jgi:hypothetical protein
VYAGVLLSNTADEKAPKAGIDPEERGGRFLQNVCNIYRFYVVLYPVGYSGTECPLFGGSLPFGHNFCMSRFRLDVRTLHLYDVHEVNVNSTLKCDVLH